MCEQKIIIRLCVFCFIIILKPIVTPPISVLLGLEFRLVIVGRTLQL
jgi:hypothetical protein